MEHDYYDDDDETETIAAPKTEAELADEATVRAAWEGKHGSHPVTGDTYPVKDKLRAIGCRWQSVGKYWQATGDEMWAKAQAIMAEHVASQTPVGPAPEPLLGTMSGKVGGSVTVTEATVEKCYEFTTEFNRKKVIQQTALFVDAEGRKFKWTSSAMPAEIKVGETFNLEGKIKSFDTVGPVIVTVLKNCKFEGIVKLVPTFEMILYCDAKSSADQFAVCDETGAPVDQGSCGLGRPSNGDNSDHELFGALRAFEFARAEKERRRLECIGLELRFDAQWMRGMVGKAKPLRDFARAHKIVVKMTWIEGMTNPADQYTF